MAQSPPKIMVFGSKSVGFPDSHDVYLGCLNCSEFSRDSIFNKMGPYGNELASNNLWNTFSPYRNPFSSVSVCNQFGTKGPVIVDEKGNFYSRLTVNEFQADSVCNEMARTYHAPTCRFAKILCADS